MRQAITTRYISATNTKGARIKATTYGGSLTISYPSELDEDQAHELAADTLCAQRVGQEFKDHATRHGDTAWQASRSTWMEPRAHGVAANGEHVHVFSNDATRRRDQIMAIAWPD